MGERERRRDGGSVRVGGQGRTGGRMKLAAVPGCELKCIFFLFLYLPFERTVVGWITNPELPPARSSLSSAYRAADVRALGRAGERTSERASFRTCPPRFTCRRYENYPTEFLPPFADATRHRHGFNLD